MIHFKQLSLRYPGGKGIFDVSFSVREGEVFGYLGPNGAGKTTTIRCALGLMRPQSGMATIGGLDCWSQAPDIARNLGFIPGEPAFMEGMQGRAFLRLLKDLRGVRDEKRQRDLLERFDLDPSGPIRRMSKGMKQKLAIVAAFAHDPAVLVLDEPTSGLDPLMQSAFIELLLEEKQRGKTILMSSHNFDEVDRTCERAAIIRDGRLQTVQRIDQLKAGRKRRFVVTLKNGEDLPRLLSAGLTIPSAKGRRAEVVVVGGVDRFLKTLAAFEVENLQTAQQSLEEAFMQFYGGEVGA